MQLFERRLQRPAARQDHRAFDKIFQFPDVSRPIPRCKSLHHSRGNRFDILFHLFGEPLDEITHQLWNVFLTFPQRRYPDGKHMQAVVQITAKFPVRDHLFEIAIRRSNQPDVDFSRHGAAQALEFTLLENPQELGLDLNWDVSHLIQEQSAFVGKFETADFLCNRSGKGSSLVAKEFAFQQVKRDSGAVQFDVRTSTTRADVVNRMRDELLACACLTLNHYSRRRGPHASYLLQHGFQRRTVANNLLERAVLILQPAQACSFETSHNYLLETWPGKDSYPLKFPEPFVPFPTGFRRQMAWLGIQLPRLAWLAGAPCRRHAR